MNIASLIQPPNLTDKDTEAWRGEVASTEFGELPSGVRWAIAPSLCANSCPLGSLDILLDLHPITSPIPWSLVLPPPSLTAETWHINWSLASVGAEIPSEVLVGPCVQWFQTTADLSSTLRNS